MLRLLLRRTPLAITAAVILGAGVLAGAWRYQQTRAALLASLLLEAQRSAVSFDPTELGQLGGTRQDLSSPTYAGVKEKLIRLQQVHAPIRFVYLFRHLPAAHKVVFLADSEDGASSAASAPGDEYREAPNSPGLQQVIATGKPAFEGPLADEFGTWVTAYAPVGTAPPGQPQDILGLDLSAADWRRSLLFASVGTAVYVWMLLVLPLAALVSTQRQLVQRDAVRNLTEAMEQGHSAVMILDLGLHIEYANAQFCRQLGYTRRELIGREWRDFQSTDGGPEVLSDMITTIRTGHSWTGEWLMPRKDGSTFPARGGITPVKDRGGITRSFVGVCEDMTEVRRTEALLREAKERAEAGDRAKGQFLATMSHEVRTPLNGVVGFASLLLETELTPEQQEYVETIRTSSETLIQLTGDILEYARIESGRLKLEPQPCDPRECIENALDLVGAAAAQKNLELLHWVDESVPGTIVADVSRLRQVIVNLVNNAVKFTHHGEVEVQARALRVDPDLPGTAPHCVLEFAVRDTGIGIAPEHHAKMFRPFSQADDSTTRRYGGTGLGLAICKNIVELMGGGISFTSEPGQGSRFVFTIRVPVHQEPPAAAPAAPWQGQRLAVAVPGAGLRQELGRLGRRFGAEVLDVEADQLPTLAGWDVAIMEVSGALAMELASLRAARPGLPPEKMIGLVPLMLPAELRSSLRHHFRLLLNKPLHHEMLRSLLACPVPAAAGSPSANPAAGASPDSFGLRVMIVEDNAVNQRLIQKLVANLGCEWTPAPNGRVAVEQLAKTAPDVILMDLHMPELDGLTATMRIRAGEAGAAIRNVWIIALTADARAEQRERTLAAGANDYLTKPVRLPDLTAAFRRYLNARMPKA
jgi:PAS domain S-box-containing protein